METIIEVKNLKKNYGDREILKDISFSIEKGEIISIIGESGAGKSTLMRCINGLEGINSGSIKFYDIDITKLKEKERNSIKKQMAYVFQDLNIIDNMYVIENVLIPFLNRKNFIQVLLNRFSRAEYERALYCLEKVGIAKLAYTKAKYLSGGEKQRLALLIALLKDSKFVILDEPTAGLDYRRMMLVADAIKKKIRSTPVMLITHDIELMFQVCNTAYLLSKNGNKKINVRGNECKILDFFKGKKS